MKNRYPTFVDILAIVGVYVGVSSFMAVLIMPLLALGVPSGPLMAISYAITMGGTIFVVSMLRRSRTDGRRWPISLRFRPAWIAPTAWAAAMIFCAGVVIEPLLELFPQEWYEWLDAAIGKGPWSAVTTVMLAPILEEWLFRGTIQPPAVAKFGPARGILLSAAIFAIIHLIPMQVIGAFPAGIILGYLFYKTGSLTPVIVLHAINNTLSLLIGDSSASLREFIGLDELYYTIYGVAIALLAVSAVMIVKETGDGKQEPTLAAGAEAELARTMPCKEEENSRSE